jgi:hypothetical protein
MEATMGSGGWAEIYGDDLGLPGRVYVRFTKVGERFRISELYVDGRGEPIQPGSLRRFAIGTVEDWLGREEWLESRSGTVGVDLSRLASHYVEDSPLGSGGYAGRTCECCGAPLKGDERWRSRHAEVAERAGREYREQAITDWVELSQLAQLAPLFKQEGLPEIRQSSEPSRRRRRLQAEPEPIILAHPVNGLTDAFLQDVAAAHRAALGQGRTDPAVAIAEALGEGAQVRTVHSWIYKARKRGFLPPARKDPRSKG